jgi:hypothetical protein
MIGCRAKRLVSSSKIVFPLAWAPTHFLDHAAQAWAMLVAARFDDVGEFPRNNQPALSRKGNQLTALCVY